MRVKYEPIGDELSIQTAAVQAAYALDSSATMAEQQRDAGKMLAVGEAWMKLADFLAALRDADSKHADKSETVKMGFQPHIEVADQADDDAIELETEDEDARSDDDED